MQSFTVAQLCEAAGLEKRDQAYTQIDRLRKEGFLQQEQLPADGRHRPLTLYRLTPDPDKREEFAREVLRYQPVKSVANDAVANDILRQVDTSLDQVERRLEQVQHSKNLEAFQEQLRTAAAELQTSATNVETALIEYGPAISPETTPAHPAVIAQHRWSAASRRHDQLEKELVSRRRTEAAKQLALKASRIIVKAALGPLGAHAGRTIYKVLKDNKWNSDPALVGRLLDEIADTASLDGVLSSFFWSSCLATQDLRVILQILKKLSKIRAAPWLEFNEENANLLSSSTVHWERLLRGYQRLGEVHVSPHRGMLGVFSCRPENLTREAYLRLTDRHRISVISHQELDFLGASQLVEPVLLLARDHRLQTFDCSYLTHDQTLHAYGPIAQDILEVPGAPSARVAACLGYWGNDLEEANLKRIIQPLIESMVMLVVAQDSNTSDSSELAQEVREVIPDSAEVAVLKAAAA
jgi:hypothetical protein